MTKIYKIFAPAKLNLGLQLLGRHDQGKHILNTVFCKINLYDILELKILPATKEIIPATSWNLAWDYKDDLVYRAASLLQSYSGCNYGVQFRLKKNIPVGAGLGGGSSDAASILYYLNIWWKLYYPHEQLVLLAEQLGDDVAAFLYFGATLYREFQHTPFRVAAKYFLLIVPRESLNTARVFDLVRQQQHRFSTALPANRLCLGQQNDLLPYAIQASHNLARIVTKLARLGISVKMTGSGSVLYLPFSTRLAAENCAKNLAKTLQGDYNYFKVVRKIDFSTVILY